MRAGEGEPEHMVQTGKQSLHPPETMGDVARANGNAQGLRSCAGPGCAAHSRCRAGRFAPEGFHMMRAMPARGAMAPGPQPFSVPPTQFWEAEKLL